MTKTFSKSLTDRLLRNLLDELEGSGDPSFTPEQIDLLERRIFEIREALTGESPPEEDREPFDAEVRRVLAEQKRIAIIWDIADVLRLRPDLNTEEAWRVLERADFDHEAGSGLNWDLLKDTAEALFPELDESQLHSESLNLESKGIDQ